MEITSSSKSRPVEIQTKYSTRNQLTRWADNFARRLIDVLVAAIGLLILTPTFLMIALAIRSGSNGPIFYKGRRVGRGGKEFKIVKFRTMYDGEKHHNGAKITAQDDPRITPIGRWLRETKINELPQLWNVLVGDMSLVGPRPEDPDFVDRWPDDYKQLLLSVRPGITSPATIIYRDEEGLLSTSELMDDYLHEIMPTKMRLDKLYVRNRSITTDLDVLFWTAVALIPKMQRLNVPQHYLYWGPISRISVRYLSWLLLDTIITFLSITVVGVLWRLNAPLDVGLDRALFYTIGISLAFSCMNAIFGLNKVEWSRAPASDSLTLAVSTGLATLAVIFFDHQIILSSTLPTSLIIISAGLAFFGSLAVRYRDRLITGTATRWLRLRGGLSSFGERVLIVGAGENSGLTSWIFGRSTLGKTSNVIGFVDDDPRKQGLRIDGYDILGTTSDIPTIVKKFDIGIIFYTIDNIEYQQKARILSLCRKTGAKVVVVSDILEVFKQELKVLHKPGNGNKYPEDQMDANSCLDEIQSLLVEYKVEEAQKKLNAFRQQFRPN